MVMQSALKLFSRPQILSKDGNDSVENRNNGTTPVEKERSRKCRVVFSYTPQHEDELLLTEGSEITVIEEVEEGWWKGELKGKVGMFPSNFVEEIQSTETNNERSSAADRSLPDKNTINANLSAGEINSKPITGQSHGLREADLKLNRKLSNGNSRVKGNKQGSVLGITPGGILSGDSSKVSCSAFHPLPSKSKENKSGLYPVLNNKNKNERANERDSPDKTKLNSASRKSKMSSPEAPPPPQLPPKPVREVARALYPYTAEHDDELTLQEGDLITVLCKDLEDKGWWKGELGGKLGVFPDNFVTLITPTVTEECPKPPRPDKPVNKSSKTEIVSTHSTSPLPTHAPSGKVSSDRDSKINLTSKQVSTSAVVNGHSDINLSGERLQHLNQNRPKGPANRRPPSTLFKGNMRLSNDNDETFSVSSFSSSLGFPHPISSPTVSIPAPTPEAVSTSLATAASVTSPSSANPSPIISTLGNDSAESAVSSTVGQRVKSADISSKSPDATKPPIATCRPYSTVASANPVPPWLQELNAKHLKRKSQISDAPDKDSYHEASAKPAVPSVRKPSSVDSKQSPNKLLLSQQLDDHDKPHQDHKNNKHEPSPSPQSSSSGVSSASSSIAPNFSSGVSSTYSSVTPHFTSSGVSSTSSVAPQSSNSGVSSASSNITVVTAGSDASKTVDLKIESNPVILRKQEPDVLSSSSSLSRKSSVASKKSREENSSILLADNTATAADPVDTADAVSKPVTAEVTKISASCSSSQSSAVDTSSLSASLLSISSHAPPCELSRVSDQEELKQERPAYSSPPLDALVTKVETLECRVEEHKKEHARQLQLLMKELDDERKKRACLEIEVERLKKIIMSYNV